MVNGENVDSPVDWSHARLSAQHCQSCHATVDFSVSTELSQSIIRDLGTASKCRMLAASHHITSRPVVRKNPKSVYATF